MVNPYPPEFADWPLDRQITFLCDIATREQLLAEHRGALRHPTGSGSRRLSKRELAELLIERDLWAGFRPYDDLE